MISSASDYIFVTGDDIDADHPHGDLDRIRIDGTIMPLRDSDDMTLRGEDVAFIKEAVWERAVAGRGMGQIMNKPYFSTRLEAYPLYFYTLRKLKLIADNYSFMTAVPSVGVRVLYSSEYANFRQSGLYALYPDSFITTLVHASYWKEFPIYSDVIWPGDTIPQYNSPFYIGAPLVRRSIEYLFDEVNQLKIVEVNKRSQGSGVAATSFDVDTSGQQLVIERGRATDAPLTKSQLFVWQYQFEGEDVWYRFHPTAYCYSDSSPEIATSPKSYCSERIKNITEFVVLQITKSVEYKGGGGENISAYVLTSFSPENHRFEVDPTATAAKIERFEMPSSFSSYSGMMALAAQAGIEPSTSNVYHQSIRIEILYRTEVGHVDERTIW